ncbi:hypothetical protein AMECASPLE_039556 [Ameca splendens]|uniref:Uncharacterized protein n=1 Tax=Ameca splendens TaxID=208324 RepID=A0ABV0YWT9_9TELE
MCLKSVGGTPSQQKLSVIMNLLKFDLRQPFCPCSVVSAPTPTRSCPEMSSRDACWSGFNFFTCDCFLHDETQSKHLSLQQFSASESAVSEPAEITCRIALPVSR